MRTQAEMTASAAMLSSWFMGQLPLSSVAHPSWSDPKVGPAAVRRSGTREVGPAARRGRLPERQGHASHPARVQVQGLNIAGRVLADH